jgi:hypothetical protein
MRQGFLKAPVADLNTAGSESVIHIGMVVADELHPAPASKVITSNVDRARRTIPEDYRLITSFNYPCCHSVAVSQMVQDVAACFSFTIAVLLLMK